MWRSSARRVAGGVALALLLSGAQLSRAGSDCANDEHAPIRLLVDTSRDAAQLACVGCIEPGTYVVSGEWTRTQAGKRETRDGELEIEVLESGTDRLGIPRLVLQVTGRFPERFLEDHPPFVEAPVEVYQERGLAAFTLHPNNDEDLMSAASLQATAEGALASAAIWILDKRPTRRADYGFFGDVVLRKP